VFILYKQNTSVSYLRREPICSVFNKQITVSVCQ